MERQSPGGARDPGQRESSSSDMSRPNLVEMGLLSNRESSLSNDVVVALPSPREEGPDRVELADFGDDRTGYVAPTLHDTLESAVAWKDLGMYILRQLLAQVQAVVPVSIYFTVFLAIVFRELLQDILELVGGLLLVIFGLTFFLEGLKIFFMPLSERIGWKLPLRFPLAPVCAVVTVLGILCTFAEPAINALVPLGDLVQPYEAPYLFWIMNPWRTWLVLSIGVGVGLSVLIGTLRLTLNWKLNPMLYITLIFAVGPAIYLQWVEPSLQKMVPLAWDIGVVATGPVTVPIVLALGNGIARSNPSLAKNPLSGFGLVALASLYPIITVQALMLFLSVLYSRDSLLIEIEILLNQDLTRTESIWEESPYQELILSVRAIIPLAGTLLAVLLLAIREELPEISWFQILKADKEARGETEEQKTDSTAADQVTGANSHPSENTCLNKNDNHPNEPSPRQETTHTINASVDTLGINSSHDLDQDHANLNDLDDDHHKSTQYDSAQESTMEEHELEHKEHPEPSFFDSMRISIDAPRLYQEQSPYEGYHGDGGMSSDDLTSADEYGRSSLDFGVRESDLEAPPHSPDALEETPAVELHKTSRFGRFKARSISFWRRHSVFLIGLASVQIGCLLFNWGIVYGLTPLALQVGGWLPSAYMHVNGLVSPRFHVAIGVLLVLIFGFVLGALVTLAEPGMAVFCRQVVSLTNGELEATFLMTTVSIGMGLGMAIGLLTLVFHVPAMYIIVGGYTIAVLVTATTSNTGLSAVAWDAAGTVTGPVTTPLVLAIGLAFGMRDPHVDGFGILTCAGIFPIVSILVTKRVLDVFTHLKGEARKKPIDPTKRGVLSATMVWEDEQEDDDAVREAIRRRRRRHRRSRHRRNLEEMQDNQDNVEDDDEDEADAQVELDLAVLDDGPRAPRAAPLHQ